MKIQYKITYLSLTLFFSFLAEARAQSVLTEYLEEGMQNNLV
jgi:hypothetical protein